LCGLVVVVDVVDVVADVVAGVGRLGGGGGDSLHSMYGKSRSTAFRIEQQVGIDWSSSPGYHGSLRPTNISNNTAQTHGAAAAWRTSYKTFSQQSRKIAAFV
jgi:hypothetical protein